MLQKATNQYIAQTRFLFYCHIKIKIPLNYPEALLDECFDLLEEIDQQYNSWSSSSTFSAINNNSGQWTKVDQTTVALIEELCKIEELTEGAYSIAVAPLLDLWGFNTEELISSPPKQKIIQETVNFIQANKVQFNQSEVKIEKGLAIATGSFIKAFAVDLVVQKLKSHGVSDALINAGGSTIVAINNPDHPYWTVNIPHPTKEDAYSYQIRLSNTSFSLSGCKTNYKTINHEKYATILNGRTGHPSRNLQTVTLTESAFIGDVLATGLFTLEEKKIDQITHKLAQAYEFKAFLVSSGMKRETLHFLNSEPKDFQLEKIC